MIAENKQCGSSKLLNDSMSTRGEPRGSLLGEKEVERSISNLNVCVLELDNIVGTNSKLTSDYQMSDNKLRWLKEVIRQRDKSNGRPRIVRFEQG